MIKPTCDQCGSVRLTHHPFDFLTAPTRRECWECDGCGSNWSSGQRADLDQLAQRIHNKAWSAFIRAGKHAVAPPESLRDLMRSAARAISKNESKIIQIALWTRGRSFDH